MNIDETTLKTFFWFLRVSEGPQKLEHNEDHNYFTVSAWEKLGAFFLMIKIRVKIVLKKILEIEIFWGHEVLKLHF